MFRPRVVWIITDKKGEFNHLCLSIAECLGVTPRVICIDPIWPLTWIPQTLIRFFPPQKYPAIKPPWPDMVLVASHRVLPYARSIKEQAADYCFVCAAMDPQASYEDFDLVLTQKVKLGATPQPNVEVVSSFPIAAVDNIAQRLLVHYTRFVDVCSI